MAKTTVLIEGEAIDFYRIREHGKATVVRTRALAIFVFDCKNPDCPETFALTEHELQRSNRKIYHDEKCRQRCNNQIRKELDALKR